MASVDALAALSAALDVWGLHVVLPLPEAAFDAAAAPLRLAELLPGGKGVLLVGDGGPAFFAGFAAAGTSDATRGVPPSWPEARPEPGLRPGPGPGPGPGLGLLRSSTPDPADSRPAPHPLDTYTRRVVAAAAQATLAPAGARYRVLYPFVDERPALPFQRLGRAAGLAPPGPLGLQIHARFGPWWAYRAAVLVDIDVPDSPPEGEGGGCDGCPAPCVAACPGGAVRPPGFDWSSCRAERAHNPGCADSCAARLACVRAPELRYPAHQLAFHMRAVARQAR